jgi:DNA-binding NarL/FixJ family response regulator
VPGIADVASIVLADPHPVVRDGLPLLLHDETLQVVARVGTAAGAVSAVARLDPDVVLAADRLPDADAATLTGRLLRAGARAAILFYVPGVESDAVQRALHAGAAGVVSTSRPVSQVARALRAAASGRTFFSESDWFDAPLTPAAERSVARADGLSESERRVLALVAAGSSTEDVGIALGVSPHTVRTHVRNLMRKLDAQSRAHAVAIAMREGATDV